MMMKPRILDTHVRALQLVEMLRDRIILGDSSPIVGYETAAKLIGWDSGVACARLVGQATSLVDYACFIAGRPMLAFNYVRKASGEMNPRSFRGMPIEHHRDEIVSVAKSYDWTVSDFRRVVQVLLALENKWARAMWTDAGERGEEFVRQALHSQVGAKPAYIQRNIDKAIDHQAGRS
jgi:hypothetical protein